MKVELVDGRIAEVPASYGEATPQQQQQMIHQALTRQPETQAMRSMWQGATFGFGDEINAAARAPLSAIKSAIGGDGEGYNAALADERAKLKAYQESSPGASAAYEIGGAVVPAVAGTVLSGGAAAPALAARSAPLAMRLGRAAYPAAKVGAAQGAAYGFGTGEGGMIDRGISAAGGAAGGAIAGGLGGAAIQGVKSLGGAVIDTATRTFGGSKAGSAVEAELQRLAEGTGLSVDDIVRGVANGSIMAENQTLRMSVRALMSQGGRGEALVRATLPPRANSTRAEAMTEIQKYLADAGDDNVMRGVRATEDAARVAENAAYANIPGANDPAAQGVVDAVSEAFKAFPKIGKDLSDYVRGSTQTRPFFSIDEAGEIAFTRQPSLIEAEITRRFLDGKARQAFKDGSPFGPIYRDYAEALRGPLDASSDALKAVRANASTIRSAKDAFTVGQTAFAKGPDEVEIMFEKATAKGPEAVRAFRAGIMAALRVKNTAVGGGTLMGKLADPEKAFGQIFRTIFPPAEAENALRLVTRAAAASEANQQIIGGSTTTLVQNAGSRLGSGINAGDAAAAFAGSPMAIMSVGMKIISRAAPELTPRQREDILKVLLSEDPQIVQNALRDESGLAKLADAIKRLGRGVGDSSRPAAAIAGARVGSDTTQQFSGPGNR
jgi:hypothetical protein